MLHTLSPTSKQLEITPLSAIQPDAIWYDLLTPTPEEIKQIESLLSLHIPSLEEMLEIEESSRLYEANKIVYMTSTIVTHAGTEAATLAPVSFIMTKTALITVRYSDPKPFQVFAKKILKNEYNQAETVFLGLMDTIVERMADILETNALDIDLISKQIFAEQKLRGQIHMQEILQHIGEAGDLNSKLRASLGTLDRQLIFYHNQILENTDKKFHTKLITIQQDIKSLSEFLAFLFHKIDFLLNATLGYTNIEQNNIIKILSVAAVIFLPPTLIASIYGMNFQTQPELNWRFGYPLALVLMALSTFIPYLYCKRKGWL